MKKRNPYIHSLILISVILLIVSTSLKRFPISDPLVSTLRYLFIFLVYTFVLALRSISIQQTILNEYIKKYFLLTIGCIFLFVFIYTFKYVAFIQNQPIQGFLWYCSYIPSIFMPLFGFFISIYVGQTQNQKLPLGYRLFYLPALCMTAGVLTNDIHQMAFRFKPNFVNWSISYSLNILYYIIGVWMFVFLSVILFSLYRKCNIPGTKKKVYLPLAVIVVGLIYTFSNAVDDSGIGFIEITFVHCLLTALLWESYIYTGLIPSNTKHGIFFYSSPLGAQITDRNGVVKYTSKFASPISSEMFEELKSKKKMELYEGMEVHCSDIGSGYIIWQEDTSSIKKMIRQLQESEETLKSNVELLQEEIKMTSHALHIKEQQRLYDIISKQTEKQLNQINLYMNEMRNAEKQEKDKLLAETNILGVYIKRCSNLILMAETEMFLSTEELKRCFVESLGSLKLYGVICRLHYEWNGTVSAKISIFLYEFFEEIVEYFLRSLMILWVSASDTDRFLKLTIHIQGESLPPIEQINWKVKSDPYHTKFSCTKEKEIVSFALRIPKKGNHRC